MLPALCLLLFCIGTGYAQITGSLLGTVTDPTGAVIPNAQVHLQNEATLDSRQTVANEVGRFTFAGVRPGSYTLMITAPDFKTWRRTGFVMNPGDTRDLTDIVLEVGSTGQVVTVEAATTQVNLVNSGEKSAVLSASDLNNLALVSRNVSELLKVLPGVTSVATSPGNGNGLGFDFTNSSSTGSAIGVGLSTNGAPYRGGSMLLMDGANIIDPGCNCWSTAVMNPEMTQEVKVTTSNFGADQPNGPIVFSGISKSGGDHYHGSAYFNARNALLNANTWQNNRNGVARQDAAWYYPGGNFGGPVPFTHNKLLFWTGYEYYWQKLPTQNPLTAWVPTDSMRAGNFDPTAADNAAVCSAVGGFSPTATNFCNDLSGTVLPNGALLTGTQIPAGAIDQNMVNLMKAYFPEPNADPSSGYNWYLPISSQQNGYVFRARVDYNITQNTKFYVSYQYGSNSSFQPAHIWWNPGNSVPFPGGGINNPTASKSLSANFLHVFSPTMTNEIIATWNHLTSPYTPNNLQAAYRATVGWNYPTVFGNGQNDLMVPNVYSAGDRTFGEMSQGDVFQHNGQFGLTKATPTLQDNLTKVYRNHTFKGGFFYSMVGNYQVNFVRPNGVLSFDSIGNTDITNLIDGNFYGSKNPVADFLMGVAYGSNPGNGSTAYQENSQTDVFDMAYRTYAFYAMDDWKVSRRLTVNAGFRFDHLGRWYERTGTGMAVWLPDLYANDVAAGILNPGVRWHGIDPGIPLSGSQATDLFISPRLGFAYDVLGTGKTVLRGGWGAYRWNDQYNDYSGDLSTAQGLQTFNVSSGRSLLLSQLGPSLLNFSSVAGSGSIYAADPTDHKVPVTYSYNFTISQQMPLHSLIEVGYVGNQTSNLLMGGQSGAAGIGGSDFINLNKIARGGLFGDDPVTGAARPADLEFTGSSGNWAFQHYFPYWQGYGTNQVMVGEHVGYSNYNGLQAAWVKQSGPLSFDLNYTWSKSLGIVNSTVDPFSVHGNYGVLNIDRPQVINTTYSYNIGERYHGNGVVERALNGWTVSGTTTWQAGANLQALTQQNLYLALQDLDGNSLSTKTYYGTNVGEILPIYTCNPGSGLSGNEKINLSCLSAPAIGAYGNRQLPYVSGPSYFDQDLAVHKGFAISERQKLEFRFSAFNLFNHPLWAFSGNNLLSLSLTQTASGWAPNSLPSNWGQVNTKSGSRIVQLGVKYSF
ncbi:MAG TPA: TonB-dependent receptor [Terriglobales bacterium]|nr:TonB-dependent receptor [Terriglobales bacterium]